MARSRATTAIIIGAGLMGRWHARAAARAGARVSAIIDPDSARARALAREFPGCATALRMTDWRDARDGVTVAHVCTPTTTHAALVQAAVERGWHALVEKPICEDAATTRQLLALGEANDRLVVPVHQFVWQHGVQRLRQRQTELGETLSLHAGIRSAGAANREADAEAIAFEILPHPLSLVESLQPGALAATRWTVARSRAGELSILGAGHVAIAIGISMHGRPTANEMTIVGSHGTAHLDLFHGFSTIETGAVSKRRKVLRPFARAGASAASAGTNLARRTITRQPAYPGLWELVDRTHAAAARRSPAPFAAHEILAVAEALDAIRALARV